MNKPRYDEPLPKAAADGLRYAAKAARAKAIETTGRLIIWKDGKVVRENVAPQKHSTIKNAAFSKAKAKG